MRTQNETKPLLTTAGASEFLAIPEATLTKWRSTGTNNIPFVKVGRAVRYRPDDLANWIERHIHGGGAK